MATPRKKRVKTVADEGYSKLEEYCIWLNEFYKSLRKAGFNNDNALWLIATKDAFPEWINEASKEDILRHIEEEEDDD
jgi:hypothetical protein